MKHKALAQKRHAKALKRKNKKYTGPKYSQVEQMIMWEPLLARVGIEMFANHKEQVFKHVESKDSTTSFV